jgi:hypothetical protein
MGHASEFLSLFKIRATSRHDDPVPTSIRFKAGERRDGLLLLFI